MNSRMFASLDKALSDWMDEECCADDFPNVIVGGRTVELMASAARNVLDACEEAQAYGIRENLLLNT